MKGWIIKDGWMLFGIQWRDLFIVMRKEKILPRQKYKDPNWQ